MAAVSEAIVREYFEVQGFLVRQQRKHIVRTQREEEGADFLVWNPRPAEPPPEPPFELTSAHLASIPRAIVVVKGWHTEIFGPGRLSQAPGIFRFVSPTALRQAVRALGGKEPIAKILVVPSLPHAAEARAQSIKVLRAKGVDAVLPFRTVLADLIRQVEVNRNYQKSDILQLLRILKTYELFREPQLELFGAKRRHAASTAPDPPA